MLVITRMYKLKFILLLLLLFNAYSFGATLTVEQQEAKQEGLKLFMQGHWEKSRPFFEIAAKAGDAEAQYYFAEIKRSFRRSSKIEAYYWYEQAAKQGDIYAMIRLGSSKNNCSIDAPCTKTPKQWKAEAIKQATAKARWGDSEAMGLLYYLTDDLAWLEKSAVAGNAYFQYFLAMLYGDGNGKFSSEQERDQTIKQLIAEAAKNGYVPAMSTYGHYLAEQGKIKEGQEWVLKAVESGYLVTVAFYAPSIGDEKANEHDILQFPLDRIKGYALLSLVSETGTGIENVTNSIASQMAEQMTSEEIEQAKAYAEEWRKTHPPLSEFIPKI